MPSRLTQSPEILTLGKQHIDYNHPYALAFLFVNETVLYTDQVTHPVVFNVLKRHPSAKALREIGVRASQSLTVKDYEWFDKHYTGIMGEMRERTLSGRAWRTLITDSGTLSVASFWGPRKSIPPERVEQLIEALGLNLADVTAVEFIDSRKTKIHCSKVDTAKQKRILKGTLS